MYMYKHDLALNNLQGLICRKTQPTNQNQLSLQRVYHVTEAVQTVKSTHCGW